MICRFGTGLYDPVPVVNVGLVLITLITRVCVFQNTRTIDFFPRSVLIKTSYFVTLYVRLVFVTEKNKQFFVCWFWNKTVFFLYLRNVIFMLLLSCLASLSTIKTLLLKICLLRLIGWLISVATFGEYPTIKL